MAGFHKAGLPDLLLYRKRQKITVELGDRETLEEQQRQSELVDGFMRRWCRSADGKSFTAASWEFADATDFEGQFEEHLRALLRKRLTKPDDIETPTTITWHQGSPYRGLESFELEHAAIFFGRTRARNEIREILTRQIERGSGFVLVIGASGSGKSSLVKAGVLPDLLLPGMIGRVALCRHAVTRPGAVTEGAPNDVLAALAQALLSAKALPELAAAPLEYTPERLRNLLDRMPGEAALPIRQGLSAAGQKGGLTERGEARLILVVDQLEELFTAGIAPEARERYVAALDALARSGLVWVIATMRSDFFDRVATLPVLAALSVGEATYLLTPPDGGEIGQIIRRPAREAGLSFELDDRAARSLDETIREAAAKSPGALPLLEYLLDQLWHRRSPDGVLTFAAYDALHGLEGAIGERAEEVLKSLPQDVQDALPAVLRALVTVSSETAAATARLVPLSAFPEASAARRLVEALIQAQARILVADGDGSAARVRVAHEALLTHWARARQQIAADRRDIRARVRLEEAEARWQEAQPQDRDSLLLARGLPLSEAEALVTRRRDELDPKLVRFVTASAQAVQAADRRRTRMLIGVAAALLVAFLGASGFAGFGWYQWGETAKANKTVQVVQRLARDSSDITTAAQRSLLLSLHSASMRTRFENDREWDALALERLRQQLRVTGGRPLLGHEKATQTAAFSADGTRLATASEDGAIRLWRVDDVDPGGRSVLLGAHAGRVRELAFSPDNTWLVSAGDDSTLRLWRVTAEGASAGPVFTQKDYGSIYTLTISPNGQWLVFGTQSGHVCIWKLTNDGLVEAPCTVGQHEDTVANVVFSAKGRWLATASAGYKDTRVRLWDFAGGAPAGPPRALKPTGEMPDGFLLGVALSADETRMAVRYDYTVDVWDLTKEDPPQQPVLRGGHGGWVWAAAFSPDGRWLATGGGDTYGKLWDLTGARSEPIMLNGHSGKVQAVGFSDDSRWMATAGDDATALLWQLGGAQALSSKLLRGQERAIERLVFSSGAGPYHLLALGKDQNSRLWSIPDSAPDPVVLRGNKGAITAAAVSADGAWIAASGLTDHELVVWSVKDPRKPVQRLPLKAPATAIAFSPNGRWLAAGFDEQQNVGLWALSDLSRPPLMLSSSPVGYGRGLGFSPDNRWLVGGTWRSGTVNMWDISVDTPSRTPRHRCRPGGPVRGVAFSADGRYAVTGEHDLNGHLWDLSAADPCSGQRAIGPHQDVVMNPAISRDGRWIATPSFDKKGRLWEIGAGGEPRLVAEAPFQDRVVVAAFSPDGKWVAFGACDNTLKVFDLTKIDVTKGVPANQPIGFAGHVGRVLSVGFTPDSRWLVSSGEDRTARLWDPGSPRTAPVVLRAHEASTYITGFLPDGRLATYSADETIMLWQLDFARLAELVCRTAGRQLTTNEIRDFIGDEQSPRPCLDQPKAGE